MTSIDNNTRRVNHIDQSLRGIEGNIQLIQDNSLQLHQEIRAVQTKLRGLQKINREASREAGYKREQNQLFLLTTREWMETMNEMLQGLDACLGAIQHPPREDIIRSPSFEGVHHSIHAPSMHPL